MSTQYEGYWERTLGGNASRRAVLRSGGVLGAGPAGAALIGCGGDDDDPSTGTPGTTRSRSW